MVEIEKQQLWVWGRMEWKIDSTEFISAFLSERINNFQCGSDHHLIPLLYEPWIHEALRITWSGISVLALFCCCFCFGKWACRVHSCGENQSIRLVFSSNRENPQLTFVFCLSVWPPFHFFRNLASQWFSRVCSWLHFDVKEHVYAPFPFKVVFRWASINQSVIHDPTLSQHVTDGMFQTADEPFGSVFQWGLRMRSQWHPIPYIVGPEQ